MKKVLLLISSVFLLVASVYLAVFSVENLAVAGPEADQKQNTASTLMENKVNNPHPEYDPHYKAGLWQDGMAVFSDIPLLDFFWPDPYKRGYRPEQPIKFSHQIHVEKNKMECQYCHSGVAKSAFATIPSVELCMGCHKSVLPESPEIKKLKEYYDSGKPVPWEPVNNLPEHVRFNHKRHIKAGFGCQNCHGQVQKMPVVERVSSLKMGFCVTCHRENGASIDCAVCHY